MVDLISYISRLFCLEEEFYLEVGMYRVERERESPNYPANPLLTYFIYSESLSILPLSESKNETLHKYSYVILLFISFEFNDLMWVWTGG